MAALDRSTTRTTWRIVFTALFVFLLVWNTQARGETTGIFYQPQNRDQSVSTREWQKLFDQTKSYNISEIVAQWNQYGTEQFNGPDGWLGQVLDRAIRADKTIWLGLYADPDYFTHIHQSDLTAQRTYLQSYLQQVKLSFQRWQGWIESRGSSVSGVYLPAEFTDYDFSAPEQREMLADVLSDFLANYTLPVMVSVYWANQIPFDQFTAWVDDLEQLGLVVLIQDDQGANINQFADGENSYDSLECSYDLIVEIYKQVRPYPDFEARRLSKKEFRERVNLRECHLNYLFSLRYLPVRRNPLDL
ncbi:DUF4434 domain-containing protein [Vibrio quintilis]|uniref:DUF4434 domain-containing protein n=1 Tax=Vibrio quintilis TaxID=1117707 RepID=UPI000937D18D|nr:DUF4434 domain-containing protein [Vibrio quintilis]